MSAASVWRTIGQVDRWPDTIAPAAHRDPDMLVVLAGPAR